MLSNKLASGSRSGIALLLCLVAGLNGCALFREEKAPPLAEARQSLYALKVWRMEGRIGVQTAEDAWQANLYWEHEPDQDRLRVSGPLSQGMISIVLQKDLIYVNEGHGTPRLSHDPEAMLKQRLGFAVPLSSLRYWVLGLPDPKQAHTPVPGDGGSSGGFRQSGWTVRMDRYGEAEGRSVPQKLRVQGNGVKLKIIADSWEIKG
jgi:outer membrane lipoprotein LolB